MILIGMNDTINLTSSQYNKPTEGQQKKYICSHGQMHPIDGHNYDFHSGKKSYKVCILDAMESIQHLFSRSYKLASKVRENSLSVAKGRNTIISLF